MRLVEQIPSSIIAASEVIYISYPSQPQTCRRCGDGGHVAYKCTEVRCFNCQKSGHRITDCQEAELCKVCHDDKHTMSYCPFVVLSANVEPAAPGTSSYADAAKVQTKETKELKQPPISKAEKQLTKRPDVKSVENKMPPERPKSDTANRYKDRERQRERSRDRTESRFDREPDRDRYRVRDRDREYGRNRYEDRRSGRDRSYRRRDRSRDSRYRDRNSDEDISSFTSEDEGWSTVHRKRRKNH